MDNRGKCFHIAADASKSVSDGYIGLKNREEYNAAILHTTGLIEASYKLFLSNDFALSVFLSITVFEESAKIFAGHSRDFSEEDINLKVKRGKDPLFNHKKKLQIVIDSLFLSAPRLYDAMGKERVEEIICNYNSGKYSELREQSLYFSRNEEKLHIPSEFITFSLAAEHLLIAIELVGELFWGMTAEASISCDKTDEIFQSVADKLNKYLNT